MTNASSNASLEPTFKGSWRRNAIKWIIASVVVISLFGAGFAISSASSRLSIRRMSSRVYEDTLSANTFSTNQVTPKYYSSPTPLVVQRAVSQPNNTGQQSNPGPSSLPPVAANNNSFPGSSIAYSYYYIPFQSNPIHSGAYAQQLDGGQKDSQEEQRANQATTEILGKLRNAQAEDRDELTSKLRIAVAEQFDIRHAHQAKQIEELEKQLQKSKELHKKRAEKKDEIVNRRMGQLLNDPDELDWNRNVIGQNNLPRYGYSLPPGSFPQTGNSGWMQPSYGPPENYPVPGMQFPPAHPQPQSMRQAPPIIPPQPVPESSLRPRQDGYRKDPVRPNPSRREQPSSQEPAENSTAPLTEPQPDIEDEGI
jgi:hypothetical protein